MPEPRTPVKPSPSHALDSALCADPLFAPPAFATPQPSPSAARFNPDDLLVSPPPPASTPDLRRKLFSTADTLFSNAPCSIRRHSSIATFSPPPVASANAVASAAHSAARASELPRATEARVDHDAAPSAAAPAPRDAEKPLASRPADHSQSQPSHIEPKPQVVSPPVVASDDDVQKTPFQFTASKCNCKASRCLKLYCPCFASSTVCAPTCTCQNCQNTPQKMPVIKKARSSVLSRDPRAFEPRVKVARTASADIHTKGCNCRKGCSKKYCVCRELKVACGPRCTCSGPKGCQNGKNTALTNPTSRQVALRGKKRNHIEQLTPPSPLHAIATAFSPGFPPLAALSPPLKLPDDPFDDLRDVITEHNDPLISPDAIKTRNACSSFIPPVNRRIALDDDSFQEHSQLSLSDERNATLVESNHSNTPKSALKLKAIDMHCSPTTGVKPVTPPSKLRSAFGSFRRSDRIEKYSRPRLPRILRVKMGTGRALKRFNGMI